MDSPLPRGQFSSPEWCHCLYRLPLVISFFQCQEPLLTGENYLFHWPKLFQEYWLGTVQPRKINESIFEKFSHQILLLKKT